MKLVRGGGLEELGTGCWMTALHYYTRKEGDRSWSDHAPNANVSPLIREMCIAVNDAIWGDELREKLIGPHLFDPVGTDTGVEDEERRFAMLLREAVSLGAPVVDRYDALTGRPLALSTYMSAIYRQPNGAERLVNLISEMCKVSTKVEVVPTKTKEEVVELKPKEGKLPTPTGPVVPGCMCGVCTGKFTHPDQAMYEKAMYMNLGQGGFAGKWKVTSY